MTVDLAVIIVTYNSAHVVEGLLDSMPSALDGLTADVLVVDNGSSDDTVAVVKRREDCRLIMSTNEGYAAGINRGVRLAEPADAIMVLNPDVRLRPHAARALVETVRQPGIGIATPRILNADGSLHYSLRREPSLARTLGLTRTRLPIFAECVNRPEEYERTQTADWAVGAVLVISRDCFEALGGFDESYFLYSEETDFCLRARDRGMFTRYEPGANAVHLGGESGQSTKTHVMKIVNRVRLYRRRHAAPASAAYLALTALREATWIPRGGEGHRAAIAALVRPALRPPELGCSDHLLPT